MPLEEDDHVLEDMAAIFHEQFQGAEVVNTYTDHRGDETYYENDVEYKTERHYQFELAYIELPCGHRLDLDGIERLERRG